MDINADPATAGLRILTWPLAAAQTTGMDLRHQHSLGKQQGTWMPAHPLVVVWIMDSNVDSGGSTDLGGLLRRPIICYF